jgi:hypothetical protein
MPTLPEIVEQLSLYVTTSAMVAVMLTAGVIVVIKDWRASLLALVIQYVIVGLLLTSEIQMELAIIKTLVGAMLCLILHMTARHVDWGRHTAFSLPSNDEHELSESRVSLSSASRIRFSSARAVGTRGTLPTEFPFRLLAAVLVMMAAYSAASAYPLPDVSEGISLAVYTLAALGLLAMGLTDEPLKAGLGLLTFFSAFELLYTVLEPSLIVVGFLGLANFLIALAIAYLTVARSVSIGDEAQTGEAKPENELKRNS